MKKSFIKIGLSSIAVVFIVATAWAFGSFGHQHINYVAIFGMPKEISMFFYNHKDFLVEEGVIPDLRKYTINDKNEGPKHFLDVEDFKIPFDSIPRDYQIARKKFGDSSLKKWGTLPWQIQESFDKLVVAMQGGRKTEILFLAGDIGHYIGDAYVPLHTTSNYDGKMTNQNGIHAFWESEIPDYFGHHYKFSVQPAKYIDDVNGEIWRMIKQTNSLVDVVLQTERNVASTYQGEKFRKDANGVILKNKFGSQIHTKEYALAFKNALDGMQEKQMNMAAQQVANFWYTAWVKAGKPDLTALDPKGITERNKKYYKKDQELLMKKGKTFGFREETEFELK